MGPMWRSVVNPPPPRQVWELFRFRDGQVNVQEAIFVDSARLLSASLLQGGRAVQHPAQGGLLVLTPPTVVCRPLGAGGGGDPRRRQV